MGCSEISISASSIQEFIYFSYVELTCDILYKPDLNKILSSEWQETGLSWRYSLNSFLPRMSYSFKI